MLYYNESIAYELKHNQYYINVRISNNNVKCENEIIKLDLEKQLKIRPNIVNALFYVCMYSYGLIKPTYYHKTVQKLDRHELPVYKKGDDIHEFLKWMNINFNNNDVNIFETKKFISRKLMFDDKTSCEKDVRWDIITNHKFNNFNQLMYHAGDWADIERYGMLYIRTFYDKPVNNINLSNNVWFNHKEQLQIWDKFDFTFKSIINTMSYMFDKMKKGILICIQNNKLRVFLPFSKHNYMNTFFDKLYIDEDDKKLLHRYMETKDKQQKQKINEQLKLNVKNYLMKNRLYKKDINLDRRKWVANDCFFRMENWEGDKVVSVMADMFQKLCEKRKLADCMFVLNIRDHPMLHKKLCESYTDIDNTKLSDKYIHSHYAPILSVGASHSHADIPMVTQDDWYRTTKKYYPDDCKNGYVNDIELPNWDTRIPKAVFRGSATGCKLNDNVRVKAALMSLDNFEYLDAGIVSFNRKVKKYLGENLQVINKEPVKKSNFMSLQEKVKYKYILNLDGHVAAFRLGHEFSLKSVILIPDSRYKLWFSHLLVPYEHYVPVNGNLDNLIDQIKWCIANDDKCKRIADNAYMFYNKYLTEDGIYDYLQYLTHRIAIKSLELPKHKQQIAIITIFRNNEDNSRLKQKRLFLHWINRMLMQICDYDIVVVEQQADDYFNIGKLKNIGFDYLNKKTKKKYDNYIFCDIDTIPDSTLIEYFFKQTDSINALASKGTRYESLDAQSNKPFVGALISCTGKVFQQINGYANNFTNWGGEDTNLLLRLHELSLPIYINKHGSIIDLEEKQNVQKDLKSKLDELKSMKKMDNTSYEKNMDYKNYKSNGLSNLNYDVLDEIVYENNYHVMVDLKLEEDKKLYPEHYFFKESVSKEEYKQKINKPIFALKKIYF